MATRSIADLQARIRHFVEERDWGQFHAPKNLSMALAVEAAELMELFQWLSEDQSRNLDAATQSRAQAEMADVFIYLLRLADTLGIDLCAAADEKMRENQRKYPAERVRGDARKYTEYD